MKLNNIAALLITLAIGVDASCWHDCKERCCGTCFPYCNGECVGRCMYAVCPEYVPPRSLSLSCA
ncbi:hypothetical protein QBC37DRAFT_171416 [Rhypophila decipiens]|uniref:Uncharacterized protein n=1 Tax=Rhypophila decipiens TaxID=261697 RepID=A0AAN7B7V6_9PEZI|nr:hypothetical protein QBC37DRAFT_171416 [Rhypophila decipiens]